jgi:hypothetical protein
LAAPFSLEFLRGALKNIWPAGGVRLVKEKLRRPRKICNPQLSASGSTPATERPIAHAGLTARREWGSLLRRFAWIVWSLALALAVLLITVWASLALWYRVPFPAGIRGFAAGVFALGGLATVVALFTRLRRPALIAFLAAFAAMLAWWSTIHPQAQGDWSPDVARQTTGVIEGDTLTLTDVRDFDWRSNTDFSERWTTRSYDLTKLKTVDLFLAFWAGPEIAHAIVSFGFEGEKFLAWSIEVRALRGGEFSPIADFFRNSPLVIIAADERDVVRLRATIRNERVELYRFRASPEVARAVLLEYVDDANRLAKTPRFYNSLTTNCTTAIVKILRLAGVRVPFDWRLIVNGYLPDYLYERGAVDTRIPLNELRARAQISPRAHEVDASPDFSRLIRDGVPSPFDEPKP